MANYKIAESGLTRPQAKDLAASLLGHCKVCELEELIDVLWDGVDEYGSLISYCHEMDYHRADKQVGLLGGIGGIGVDFVRDSRSGLFSHIVESV